MKQFIVDRHTTPNTPTLEQVPTDKIPLYPTEQDLLDDLANLEVGQIAGTTDPAESELIGVLIQKIQALESKLESDDVYSTDEVMTNKTWIDGKPIYRKCFYSATNWSNDTVLVTDATIERCIKLSSFADNGNGMYFENLNDGSNIGNCWHNVTDNTIRVTRHGAFANSNPSWVIIEYTKTSA